MRATTHFPQKLIALAIVSAFGAAAYAEDVDLTEYVTPDRSLTVGVGQWTHDRPHEGMYDGMAKNGAYGGVEADIRARDDATGTWTNLNVRIVGENNTDASVTYERQGNWGINLGYSQTPRANPVTINTGLQGIGTERQRIVAVTPGAGADYHLQMRRDATSVTLFTNFAKDFDFHITFKNEEKTGDRQWGVRSYPTLGATGGSYPAFVAEPLDSTTRQLDVTLAYAGEKLRLTGGYYGSWYDNRHSRLDVIGTGNGVTEMSLPPDNEAHQGYLQGSYAFSPTSRGMFKVAYTHASQNDRFMTTGNNNVAAWAPMASVGSSLNGVVTTKELTAGLTSRPINNLSLATKLSYWDRQDRTPFRIDGQNSGGTIFYHNNPFSSSKASGTLDGTYRLGGGFSLIGGLDYSEIKREFNSGIDTTVEFFSPYRTKLKETTARIGAKRSLSETVNGSLVYSHSRRTGSTYVLAEADWNDITPIHIANRKRDRVKLAIDWNPTQSFGMQFGFADSRDSYPAEAGHANGVRKGTAQLWSIDATLAITEDLGLNAWYSYDVNNIDQTGIRTTTWTGGIKDRADTFGVGAKGKITGKIDAGLNFDWTRSHTDYRQSTSVALAGGVALPSIENRISRINLFGNYTVDKHSSVRIDFIHEDWKTDDWTWAFSNGTSYSYATEGTRITNPLVQASTYVGARYTFKF